MAKIKSPDTFADCFAIDPVDLRQCGVLNPTLAADVPLFIDPLLLSMSAVREMRIDAAKAYEGHFGKLIRLLAASESTGDVAWRAAEKMFEFHEIPGTCLGYGAGTIHGSGFGKEKSWQVLITAREIVALGIQDPHLFPLLALLEDGVGSDLIGDMVTNVALPAFFALTARVTKALRIPTQAFSLAGQTGFLPRNPLQERQTPVILVAEDILRPLPIAKDWDGISDAAAKNEALRQRVNQHIGHLLATATTRNKGELRSQALSSREAFQALLDAVKCVPKTAYPMASDPKGIVQWSQVGRYYAKQNRLALERPNTPQEAFDIVGEIIDQFQKLVEENGLSHELWNGNKPRQERTAQRLFFVIAHTYCRVNKLDVTTEADAGRGPVDFKFSSGFDCRVVVEIKLSTNTRLVDGYEKQLPTYARAEETQYAYFLVIDVGKMGKKDQRITNLRKNALSAGHCPPAIVFVDGMPKPSASHL